MRTRRGSPHRRTAAPALALLPAPALGLETLPDGRLGILELNGVRPA